MLADLHAHSHYSDGLLPPARLAQAAAAAGLDIVALTDHDTTAGVVEMNAACAGCGVRNLPGVEISAFDRCDVHILGYNIDCENAALSAFLSAMAAARAERIGRIADKLAGYGMPIDFDALKRSAAGSLSRGHLARALLEKGYETDFKACFDKWLNPGCPCYLPQTRALPEEAIDIIHAAGGAAVLAHPVRLRMPDRDKAALIARLARAGLDGLEAVYKDSPESSVAFFRTLAADNGLFVTPGGDFHAPDTQCLYPRPLDPDAARALGVAV